MLLKHLTRAILLLTALFIGPFTIAQQRFADLGNFRLESGQIIQNCRVGYRTFGRLNAARSNAILVPTWFGGISANTAFVANPGGIADSTRYFAIVVDALGKWSIIVTIDEYLPGWSAFPQFSIRDLVRSQYELVTKTLGFSHLFAVTGISMGGMQSFEWLVSYPGFMDKVVPIVGTPKQSSYDKLFWGTQLMILERGNFSLDAMKTVGDLHELNLSTPGYFRSHLKLEDEPGFVTLAEYRYSKQNPYDWASQLRAMIGQDIFRGQTMSELKPAIKASLMIVVATQDHMVTPGNAIEFAHFLQVPLLELASDCGHLATSCEEETLRKAVGAFLKN